MSSPSEGAAKQSAALAKQTAETGYGIGIPALQAEQSQINQGLTAGGEPDYVKQAFGAQRTGMFEGASLQEQGQMQNQSASDKGAIAGGNMNANMLVPPGYGAEIARAMLGSATTEKLGGLEESMNLMGMGLGGAGQAGSAAMTAGGASLKGIGMMPQYNQGLADVLMAANTAGSVYGAGSQAGWWGGDSNLPVGTGLGGSGIAGGV